MSVNWHEDYAQSLGIGEYARPAKLEPMRVGDCIVPNALVVTFEEKPPLSLWTVLLACVAGAAGWAILGWLIAMVVRSVV